MKSLIKQIPITHYIILLASTSIAVGVEWDISWHSTIGRDKLLSPPHLVVYLGGILCGFACSWIVFQETFFKKSNNNVKFWGFRAPLACWICIWGMIAMLASAPFDDWWHKAYGLDVQIISPPHLILALGIFAVILGGCILILSKINIEKKNPLYDILYLYAASLILIQFSIVLTEYSFANKQHSYEFYLLSCIVYTFIILAFKVPSKYYYAGTYITAFYMIHRMLVVCILPLFPAEPTLGPIYREINSFVAPYFPVLLIIPAFFIDLIYPKIKSYYLILKAIILSLVFCSIFFAVQWNFSKFLLTRYAENWFFASGRNVPYFIPIGEWEGKFFIYDISPLGQIISLTEMNFINFLWIVMYGSLSITLAIGLSFWLKNIKR